MATILATVLSTNFAICKMSFEFALIGNNTRDGIGILRSTAAEVLKTKRRYNIYLKIYLMKLPFYLFALMHFYRWIATP